MHASMQFDPQSSAEGIRDDPRCDGVNLPLSTGSIGDEGRFQTEIDRTLAVPVDVRQQFERAAPDPPTRSVQILSVEDEILQPFSGLNGDVDFSIAQHV